MKAYIAILIGIGLAMGCNSTSTNLSQEKAIDAHNSLNSLDWAGIYRGAVACKGCKTFLSELTLFDDQHFTLSQKEVDGNNTINESEGPFQWDSQGRSITLSSENFTLSFLVGENYLILLDEQGNKLDDNNKTNVLTKNTADQTIENRYWELIELKGQKFEQHNDEGREAHFILKSEDGKVVGNGGCNSFFGTYELSEGNQIRFSKMGATMMACLETNYETEYLKVFEIADNYTLKNDTLSLNKARMAPLARFKLIYLR